MTDPTAGAVSPLTVTDRSGHQIEIYWRAPSMWSGSMPDGLAPAERARRDRLRRAADRHRFAAAWWLTRQVLGQRTGRDPATLTFTRRCRRCGDPDHGKPRLVGDGPEFNLSHSGDRVLLAVSDHAEVGVDVEQRARALTDLRGYILHPDERVEDLDLLRVWTRKEALLKASGDGLVIPMRQIRHEPTDGSEVRDLDAGPDYAAAVAWRSLA